MAQNRLTKDQKAAARQLSLAAYLLGSSRSKGEGDIKAQLLAYDEIYVGSLRKKDGDEERAVEALRKQLARDVEALGRAGIRARIEGTLEGRLYSVAEGPTLEFAVTDEERAVLVGALKTFGRGFPYSTPLRLAVYNLIGEVEDGVVESYAVDVPQEDADEVARRLANLEKAIYRRKRVEFEYYAISRDEISRREVEPHALSFVGGSWYLTGRDVGKAAVCQFRLSRVRGLVKFATKSEGGEYEVPEESSGLYGPRAPWQLGEPECEARILLSDDAAVLAPRANPDAGVVEQTESGPVFVTPYSGERQLTSWVFSFGEDAQVLFPASLVGKVRESLGRLVAVHEAAAPVLGYDPDAVLGTRRSSGRNRRRLGQGSVKPEPTALELALARYAASMPVDSEVSHEELAGRFGCSVKEVEKALEVIQEVSDENLTTTGVLSRGGRLTKEIRGGFDKDFRRPIRLSPLQGRALLLALDLVSGAVDPELFARLRNKVRTAVGEDASELSTEGPPAEPGLIAAVEGSVRNGRTLEIRYPGKGEVKDRVVEPLLLFKVGPDWYLKAYCRLAQGERRFLLERMISARSLGEHFERREGDGAGFGEIDPRGYAAHRAVVRFSAEVARWMTAHPEMDRLAEHEDGSADYLLYYKDASWAAKRVMSYRGEAVVVARGRATVVGIQQSSCYYSLP